VTVYDRSRRYLVAVGPLGMPDEPDDTHLAVLGWNPRVEAWVHGVAICGRSVAQGEVTPAGRCCRDCLQRAAEYTLILETP
jgi:hypothetical protein